MRRSPRVQPATLFNDLKDTFGLFKANVQGDLTAERFDEIEAQFKDLIALATANLEIFYTDQILYIDKILSYASSPQLRHLHRRSRSRSQSRTEAVESGGDSSGSFTSTMADDSSGGGGGGGMVHPDGATPDGSALAIVKLKRQILELQRKKEAEKLCLMKEAEEKQYVLMMEELDVMEAAAGSGVPLDVLESMGMMKLGSVPPPSPPSHSPPPL